MCIRDRYNFGLQASANWKGFDFSMNWSGAAGFKIYYYRLALNSSALAPAEIGIGVLQAAGENDKRGGQQGFRHLPM